MDGFSTTVIRVTTLVLGALWLSGCAPHPLDRTQPSPETLGREVLEAVSRRDVARLEALALTEAEFQHRIWPGLPAARPERNVPWSYVWMDLHQKSRARLAQTLEAHGGRPYELLAVRFAGETTRHGTFQVHRGAVLTVQNPAGGGRQELRVLGSMIEADTGWKVFSYVVDD